MKIEIFTSSRTFSFNNTFNKKKKKKKICILPYRQHVERKDLVDNIASWIKIQILMYVFIGLQIKTFIEWGESVEVKGEDG